MPLICAPFFTGCNSDDQPEFCDGDNLSGCTPLQALSEQEHFNALQGSWTVIHTVSGWGSTNVSPNPPETSQTIVFNADSTFTSVRGDIIESGRWENVQESGVPTESLTRINYTEGISLGLCIRNTCGSELAFTNDTPSDGPLNIFRKE